MACIFFKMAIIMFLYLLLLGGWIFSLFSLPPPPLPIVFYSCCIGIERTKDAINFSNLREKMEGRSSFHWSDQDSLADYYVYHALSKDVGSFPFQPV